MAGLVPATHDFALFGTASRGWPRQARSWHKVFINSSRRYS